MAYKTLVASSVTQQRWVLDSNAHTLQELKQEFRNNNIPYDGLAITEGLCTKAELTRDDAEIPVSQRTVNYNGETFSRVFLITNARKQIASGADYPTERKQFGSFIKANNYGGAIQAAFVNNWTRVSTDKLIDFFKSQSLNEVREEIADISNTSENSNKLPDIKEAPHPATVEWLYSGIKNMVKENSLFIDDVAVIAGLVTELYNRMKEEQVEMTDSDIDDMLYSY